MSNYQAQFYYQSQEQIYYVGSQESDIDKVNTKKLIDELFPIMEEMLMGHPEFDYVPSKKHIRRSYFTRNKNKLIIYLWIGHNEPLSKICYTHSCGNVTLYTLGKQMPGWLCGLDYPSLFFAHTEKFFLTLLNRYVDECSNKNHQRLLGGRHYLALTLYSPSCQLPPYVVGCMDNIEASPRRLRFKRCPSSHLPCEMNTLYMRLTWYVRRTKWNIRAEFCTKDIRL